MADELLLTPDEIRFAAGTIEGEIDLSDLTMTLMTGVAKAQLAKAHYREGREGEDGSTVSGETLEICKE